MGFSNLHSSSYLGFSSWFYSFLALMIFQCKLSIILLSMLAVLLCVVNVIRLLICGNNFNWLQNFNLLIETLQITLVYINFEIDEYVLDKEWSFWNILGLSFSSKHKWGSCIISVGKNLAESWKVDCFYGFLFLKVSLISINLPSDRLWNTYVIFGLLQLIATWIYWITIKTFI